MIYLSGNEALARAFKNMEIEMVTGYPGTPSTEIIEVAHSLKVPNCSWAINEKVALEQTAGASYAGARSVCIMKHVGLNVASDPFMTLSYTGVFGALILVTCDDPGAYSSQNEQDNRNYSAFAKIPMLEPATPQECYDFLKYAITLSEKFDTPVLFRMTTRVCTHKALVKIPEKDFPPLPKPQISFRKEQEKLIMTPRMARIRHPFIEKRLEKLSEENSTGKVTLYSGKKEKNTLLLTSGSSYLFALEAFPDLSLLKLGFTYPLPKDFLIEICKNYKEVVCIEELDPFLEKNLLDIGISNVRRKNKSFYSGDYTLKRVKDLVHFNEEKIEEKTKSLPPPPPNLCSGCPHLSILNIIREFDLNVCGDIGCYTIGSGNPFYAMHSVLDMGASIPMSTGAGKVLKGKSSERTAAIIGDSTFFHSGITGIIDAVQNRSNALIFILDNATTAMTGRQGHAGVGDNLLFHSSPKVDYEKLLQSIGIMDVQTLDPYDFKNMRQRIAQGLEKPHLQVFLMRRECALLIRKEVGEKKEVSKRCISCGDCLRLGCPAISYDQVLKRPKIDQKECIGCDICEQVCEFDSIVPISTWEKEERDQSSKDSN